MEKLGVAHRQPLVWPQQAPRIVQGGLNTLRASTGGASGALRAAGLGCRDTAALDSSAREPLARLPVFG